MQDARRELSVASTRSRQSRRERGGKTQYAVRWEGAGEDHDTVRVP